MTTTVDRNMEIIAHPINESAGDRIRESWKFWARVTEAGEFDIEHLLHTQPYYCLLTCQKRTNLDDYRPEIILYARFGIHKYNMIQGTNLQLSSIEKYNHRPTTVYSADYITLIAKDPASGGSLATFQTRVISEGFLGIKTLYCDLTNPKSGGPQGENPMPCQRRDDPEVPLYNCFSKCPLPEWPSSDQAFYNNKKFYVVKKSEVRKHDWIRLYMELAFLQANRPLKNPKLSKLVIVKVAVETEDNVEPPCERLKAKRAVFYIKYRYHPNKGLPPKALCHHPPRDRIAIVRRYVDKNTGDMALLFEGNYTKTFLNSS